MQAPAGAHVTVNTGERLGGQVWWSEELRKDDERGEEGYSSEEHPSECEEEASDAQLSVEEGT